MTMYFKATMTWVVAEDDTLAQAVSGPLSSSKIESTDITEHVGRRITLADGVTDQAINFVGADGLTTAKALMIKTDQPITAKLNGSSTAIPIGHAADEPATLMIDATTITSLSLSNASGNTANIIISLPGA